MNRNLERKNRVTVLEAFETLFIRWDYAAAEKFWSPHYIQHNRRIGSGLPGSGRGVYFVSPRDSPSLREATPGTI